jgi:hypothetical protein
MQACDPTIALYLQPELVALAAHLLATPIVSSIV